MTYLVRVRKQLITQSYLSCVYCLNSETRINAECAQGLRQHSGLLHFPWLTNAF